LTCTLTTKFDRCHLSLTLLLMYRLPTLISRAVLCAPMIRNKCGVKYFDFKFAPPQPLVYWVTVAACYAGTFVVAAVRLSSTIVWCMLTLFPGGCLVRMCCYAVMCR
jgi:hypothetical protein